MTSCPIYLLGQLELFNKYQEVLRSNGKLCQVVESINA
jgi:hypothetical protein